MRRLSALLVLALLAGCGTVVRPGAHVQPGAVRAAARDEAAPLIAGLRGLSEHLDTFSAVVDFWELDKDGPQTSTAEVYTARPGKIRANITAASSPLKKGAKVLYLGDRKVTIKLGIIKRTLPYDDPQVTSVHNWRIDQTDLNALIGGLCDPAGQAAALGPVTVNGQAGQSVQVLSPTMLPGVSSETVVLDPTTFMPLHFEAAIGTTVVYKLDIRNAQINPALPADIFNL